MMWLKDAVAYASITAWLTSPFGFVLTFGGLCATAAAYSGITGISNNVERLVDIGDEVAASGAPPMPQQGSRMAHLGAGVQRHSKIDLVPLFLAVTAMATARY
jgi:hypothetical protein